MVVRKRSRNQKEKKQEEDLAINQRKLMNITIQYVFLGYLNQCPQFERINRKTIWYKGIDKRYSGVFEVSVNDNLLY